MSRLCRIAGVWAVCLAANWAFSQETFERGHYPAQKWSVVYAAADLNGDGESDLISAQLSGLGNTDGFAVYLSNGDGTFQPPVPYSPSGVGPAASIVTADFNKDGKTDVIAAEGPGFYIYLGNGDGTFKAPTVVDINNVPLLAAADVNHDGNTDLILLYGSGAWVMYGNGNATFKNPAPVYTVQAPTETLVVGDFDGDGNIDMEMHGGYTLRNGTPVTTLVVLYGDGKGAFSPVVYDNINAYLVLSSADVNQDGRSDLAGGFDCASAGCGMGVQIYRGNANRTLTSVRYPTTGLAFFRSVGAVADFNGDGRQDIALDYVDWGGNAGVAIFPRAADGSYQTKTLDPLFGSDDYVVSLLTGKVNRDLKPDLATMQQNSGSLQVLLDTTSGHFPSCQPPKVKGIHVCRPMNGATVASPVRFNVAASSFKPIRKIEVWIDGSKRSETYFSWNLFAFSQPTLSLPTGTHRADLYAGDWDGTLQHVSVTFAVK